MKQVRVLLAAVLLCCLPALGCAFGRPTPPAPRSAAAHSAVPLLAYYYPWYDPASWRRGKTDLPVLGRYSGADPNVVRQHIRWARSAGIDGFIVSWKDTPRLDARLELLMRTARAEHFKLAMIYQGLDFHRRPLPVDRVAADFRTFRDRYAFDPVLLRLGGQPLTLFSGTWKYTRAQVARVTGPVRPALLVLATEKNPEGCRRLSGVTDGDAYYWSSVDPYTAGAAGPAKLRAMARAVHADGHYWIAPFAPGFDARLIGGTSAVPRRDGRTLRAEYAAAVRSSPDALGLISWNEFSENSQVEPSKSFGTRYLDVLRTLHGTVPGSLAAAGVDSSDGSARSGAARVLFVTAGVAVPALAVVCAAATRRRRRP